MRARARRGVARAARRAARHRRRRLGVRSRRRAFPRPPAPSRGHGSPPDALNAGNASCSAPPVRVLPWTTGPFAFPSVRRAFPRPWPSRPPRWPWASPGAGRCALKAGRRSRVGGRPRPDRPFLRCTSPSSLCAVLPEHPPPLALVAAVPCLPSGAAQLPNRPAPPRPLPDRSSTGAEPHRGQPAWAPPAGRSRCSPTRLRPQTEP
jgi:hypothetical protein